MTTDLKDRPAVRYDIERTSDTAVQGQGPQAAAPAPPAKH
jgi:hypothetical protein